MKRLLWINGAFGSGKTVTAAELNRRLPDSFIYDPENIGFFLRKNTPSESGRRYSDFQDDPLWRRFNYDIIIDIVHSYSGFLIVPMTVIRPEYYLELIGRMRLEGVSVDHYILGADRAALLRRQRSRLDFKNSWSARNLDACIEAFKNPLFEGYMDTTDMTPEQAAEYIAKTSGLTLLPEKHPLPVRRLHRLITQLKHLR